MVWLIGAHGMLGTEIARQLTEKNIAWVGTDRAVDITDQNALARFMEHSAFDRFGSGAHPLSWIVNCAAYTAVEQAQKEPQRAYALNVFGPRTIASIARAYSARLIHFSTDYVFGGDGTRRQPFSEDDTVHPVGTYGCTKAAGETAIQEEMTDYYIIRTAWLYGFTGNNFVYTMTRQMNEKKSIQVVDDQYGTPTNACDVAAAVIKIISTDRHGKGSPPPLPFGTYHYTNGGMTTRYGFARAVYLFGRTYARITRTCTIVPCTTEAYGSSGIRPAYSVLDTKKIARFVQIPLWEESLERFICDDRFTLPPYPRRT
ncbi:MAG: dTDP-4-dehydrorhamnose reductase [Treponema sp.]|nr:dTDP-4-dehydrorhamnose reductase [Treponema sp.]